MKVKGPKADEDPTFIDGNEPKSLQTKHKLKKKDKQQSEMISHKRIKVTETGNKLNIKEITIKRQDTQKKVKSNEATPAQKLSIPPDLDFMKHIKATGTKTDDLSYKVAAKPLILPKRNQTIRKDSTTKPNDTPVQRIVIIPPPDMDFMMELDKHRFNIRTVMQNSNATPIRNHVKSGFVCCFCDAHFPKPADLKVHTIQSHADDDSKDKYFRKKAVLYSFMVKLDITSLTCNLCHMAADTLDQLIHHLNGTHQKGLHTDIKNHIVCFKFDSEVMRCLECLVEFNSFKLLSEHMNQHYTNFVCDECGVGFINRRQLLLHSDKHKVGAHKCGSCDKVFQSLKRMKTHERITHVYNSGLGTHGYRCNHCSEKFKNKKAKMDHMAQTHGV